MSRALAGIEQRLGDAQRKLDAPGAGRLRAGAPGRRAPASARAAGKRPERPPPYREFRSSTGAAILVGRGADRNDELTFKVARGNDLWLHTRDVAGAHVVVPLSRPPRRRRDTARRGDAGGAPLERARRGAGRRRLRRAQARAQAAASRLPGTVTHAGGKTIRVRMEPERLARLLGVARRRGPLATRPARRRAAAQRARSPAMPRRRVDATPTTRARAERAHGRSGSSRASRPRSPAPPARPPRRRAAARPRAATARTSRARRCSTSMRPSSNAQPAPSRRTVRPGPSAPEATARASAARAASSSTTADVDDEAPPSCAPKRTPKTERAASEGAALTVPSGSRSRA